ncbi:LysR substrate-binding domain-containing protein [Roseovarius sp. 2305UL8-3]|uniref:LysR substrate-binding domain-containing protein n=1 Tax=Roseovarius conchicola TaxID=3121636 RepID=UPI003528FCEC
MQTLFRHHDLLRLFAEIARYPSFSDAAEALNMTKGAISYQIKTLEADLGMALFRRSTRGVTLTGEGLKVLAACRARYEDIEAQLLALRGMSSKTLTIGVSTYFAARWLSPLLMSFMQDHQDVQLRIQPLIQFSNQELEEVDLAIRWGAGDWRDVEVTPFMPMPAFPVGNKAAFEQVKALGLAHAITSFTLLRDRDDSNAWTDWLQTARLPQQTRRDVLIVPDPNVRVQAVIDGQGIALMDDLIKRELDRGKLFRLSEFELSHYGYFLVHSRRKRPSETVVAFFDWAQRQIALPS